MLHRRYCIMLVLCLTALSLAACGGGGTAQPAAAPARATAAQAQPTAAAPTTAPSPAPTATPQATATSTSEPTAEPMQPVEMSGTKIDMNNPVFKAYFAAYDKFPRRTYAEVFSSEMKQTTTVLIETDAKDRLRLEIGGASGTNGITTSMIIISPTLYVNQGTGWLELPGDRSGMLSMLTDSDSLQQLLNAFDELASYTVKPLGPETVNGVSAMAYASEFALKDGTTSKGKAWIGVDGLLVQDHIETSSGTVVTTTYTFDPNIKVEAPLP